MCVHLRTYTQPDLLQQFSLGAHHTKVERKIMSQLQLRMVQPWPVQPDWFWHLCDVEVMIERGHKVTHTLKRETTVELPYSKLLKMMTPV